MSTLFIALIGLLIMILGTLATYMGLRAGANDQVNQRLQEFVIEPERQQARWQIDPSLYSQEYRGSFISRTITPLFRRIGGFFGRLTPAGTIDSINKELVKAGNPLNLGAREFYGIRILFMFLAALLGYMIIQRGEGNPGWFVTGIMMAIIVFYLPKLWLRRTVHRKQEQIRRNLPDGLDMLSVCADAGLGFDQSLQRVSETWKTPLAIEFSRVVTEMNLGVSRSAAMRNMAERLEIPELSSFVAVIIQSDELGMSIADTLHAQANQMRIERRYWAQEQARKIPTKMLFPLVFLILPAMFIVVLGPAVPALIEVFQGF
jgi:tight adherence protein C